MKWRYRDNRPMMGGVLSTAGGVVYQREPRRRGARVRREDGKVVWRFRAGGGVRSQPVAYQLDGRTYVAIPTGSFTALDSFAAGVTRVPEGGTLFVFALPK